MIAVALLGVATPSFASQTPPTQQPPTTTPAVPPPTTQTPPAQTPPPSTPPATTPAKPADPPTTDPPDKDRVFGVLPNYTTVTGGDTAPPITSKDAFKMAALDSFDPFVYPLFGFIAEVGQVRHDPPEWGGGLKGYSKRYGAAFADNTICSLVTTGLMPSLLKQDPRYYQGRAHGFLPRLGYAAKSSVVTRSRTTGHKQFNASEIGGTFIVASVGNLYYPANEHNMPDTLTRWGMQTMWDTVANELKEFWPDIKKKLHHQ